MNNDKNPYRAPDSDIASNLTGEDEATKKSSFSLHEPRFAGYFAGFEWIGEGFGLFKKEALTWILMMITGFILMLVLLIIPFVNIISFFLIYVWFAGLLISCKVIYDGDKLTIGYLFSGFSAGFGSLLLLAVIMILVFLGLIFIVLVPVLTQISTSSTDVPSLLENFAQIQRAGEIVNLVLIPVHMGLCYAAPLIALNKVPIFKALILSFKACFKNFVPLFIYFTVISIVFVLGMIPLLLGLLIVIPLFAASFFLSYKDIFID